MPQKLTDLQIQKLHSIGINPKINLSQSIQIQSKPLKKKHTPAIPLLSISGLTLLSFGSLLLFKNKVQTPTTPTPSNTKKNLQNITNPTSNENPVYPTATQVPKSIQHFLLASQQSFSRALQMQSSIARCSSEGCESGSDSNSDQSQIIELLNQSILSATDAINTFPQDYRAYFQRATIYQALIDSQPQFIDTAITDLSTALKLNPNSANITRQLASLYAKKGDANNTLTYLAQTVTLEPTKAQNFYDLALIQQQTGLIPQALDTYNQLLPLITDPTQIADIKSQVIALKNLNQQNPTKNQPLPTTKPLTSPTISLPDSTHLIEANSLTSGLIIASPEDDTEQIKVDSLTDSNALSGTATLPANQSQITLENSNLTSKSQVYLSILTGGKNQTLQLISKSENSFTVGLPSPISEDIQFKWWIIQ